MLAARRLSQALYRRRFLKTENQRDDADGLVDEVIAIAHDEQIVAGNQILWSRALYRVEWSARPTRARYNKSLDASGGSVFRIMTGPAMLE